MVTKKITAPITTVSDLSFAGVSKLIINENKQIETKINKGITKNPMQSNNFLEEKNITIARTIAKKGIV